MPQVRTRLPEDLTSQPVLSTAAIGVGSNLGDRVAHIEFAMRRLEVSLVNQRVSSLCETEPVGVGDPQPLFLNAVIVGDSLLDPGALMAELLGIERERGRVRPHPGAARTLDLDLILFGDRCVNVPGLTVPHPRFRERFFVLVPLAEVAPTLVDPVTGRTVAELLETLQRGEAASERSASSVSR